MLLDFYKTHLTHCEKLKRKIHNFPNLESYDPNDSLIKKINDLADSKESSLDQLYNCANEIVAWFNHQSVLSKEKAAKDRAAAEEKERQRKIKEKQESHEREVEDKKIYVRKYAKSALVLFTFSSLILAIISGLLLFIQPLAFDLEAMADKRYSGFDFLFNIGKTFIIVFLPFIYNKYFFRFLSNDEDMKIPIIINASIVNSLFFEKMTGSAIKWIKSGGESLSSAIYFSVFYYPVCLFSFLFLKNIL
jgi:hypothetical protein